MIDPTHMDHLFRHQYGKMVSILTRIFGLSHIETIEDAVQDTFAQAITQWKIKRPENPEAWLTQAAKNRTIDLFRQIKAEKNRFEKVSQGSSALQFNEFFLSHEIEDSQLRMIFVACHPLLDSKEQIAFALKTISGFSMREIAAALLIKEETVKKRLIRARKKIAKDQIQFEFPGPKQLPDRLNRVLQVIYLTFNEGFHSNHPKELVREELCGEALRLCQILLKKQELRNGTSYALFALMCLHASRLKSKISEDDRIISLKDQDRSLWYPPLIALGKDALSKTNDYQEISTYHYEAAIILEHIKATSFEDTNWVQIAAYYDTLYQTNKTPSTLLNQSIVLIQLGQLECAYGLLQEFKKEDLSQRSYLYFGALAEYYEKKGDLLNAISSLEQSLNEVTNRLERNFIEKKLIALNKRKTEN